MNNNYSNTEKSLKRWLKTRVKVTMATVVGFLIAGNVVMGAEDYNDKQIITQNENENIIIDKDFITTIDLEYDENDSYSTKGLRAENKGKISLIGKNIDITVNSDFSNQTSGITARATKEGAGEIHLGNAETELVKVNVNTTGTVVGIGAQGGGNGNTSGTALLKVEGKKLEVNVTSEEGWAYGILAQNATTNAVEGDKATVIINAENTVVNVESGTNEGSGLVAMSQGIMEINGNLEVNADTAITTRGNSFMVINKNNDKTIKLNGDINFDYNKPTSGTTVDSGLILNLSNAESYLNGKISVTGNPPEGKDEVTGMKLGLSNGGTWNVTGDSFVNDLTMNGGVINILQQEAVTLADNDGTSVKIDTLRGNGGSVTYETTITGNNVTVAQGGLEVGGTDGKTALSVGFSGVDADDLAKTGNVSGAFKALKSNAKITGTDGTDMTDTVVSSYFAEEGKVSGAITAVAGKGGELVISQAEESKTVMGLKDLATINYLSWKQEMNSLSQRMGELRNSSAEHGVWARVYGGKVENGDQYDNEYQTYQVGYDKKYSVDGGNLYVGYLVSYTDGETNYELGHGENDSIGAGIYATWLNNNGHYVDVLYKVSRLNNKFDVGSTNDKVGRSTGDYDTMGISLSAEYGKRFDLTEKWFAEPSIGMHLGRLGDESYTTNGIEVSQDSIYTAEGRIGTAVGYKFTDKGNVYVRTHLVKEFAGEVDATYTADGLTRETSEDMGDSWFEFGAGVNYRFAENLNIYADIEKSGDSTVDTEWQGNLGFRYEF